MTNLFVDDTGSVEQVRLSESSGQDAMDQAALEVAGIMEFTPARNGSEPVPVWIRLNIGFDLD